MLNQSIYHSSVALADNAENEADVRVVLDLLL